MIEPFRVIVGTLPVVPGAHAALAIRITDFARQLHMRIDKVHASRITCSRSHYIAARDLQGRCWIVRISDHRGSPEKSGFPIPHLNLVSLDGVAGYDEACRFLGQAVAGGVPWRDPTAGVRQPRRRR